MYDLAFYYQVVSVLDEIDAPYMIVGAFAGLVFGITRSTFDIDILVDLQDDDIEILSRKFPLPRYYADPEMIRNSIRMGIMFNLIDTEEGVKADLVPLIREPDYEIAFSRRIRRRFSIPGLHTFEAWCAQPTDIIIGKLQAWTEGRSSKHAHDIHQMLVFEMRGYSTHPIFFKEVEHAAEQMGLESLKLWLGLVELAQQSVEGGKAE
jgi:hypothetical protein